MDDRPEIDDRPKADRRLSMGSSQLGSQLVKFSPQFGDVICKAATFINMIFSALIEFSKEERVHFGNNTRIAARDVFLSRSKPPKYPARIP